MNSRGGRTPGVAVMLVAAGLLAGCLAAPRPQLPPRRDAAAMPSPAPPPPSPTSVPAMMVPPLSEGRASDEAQPAADIGAAISAPPREPESLLARIDSSTRPNVAAALRLVEEGRVLLERKQYDEALDHLERALTIDPSNAYGYYLLARLHYQQRSYHQAIAFAGNAAVLAASADQECAGRAYALQGAVFEEVGRYADARAAYRRALAADAGNLAAQVGIGRLGGDATVPHDEAVPQ